MVSKDLLKALAVTVEICDRPMSDAAALVMAMDLEKYPETQILGALRRCRLEVKGKLCTADIVNRLDDGRPTADEAWSMYPHSEGPSAILNNEISESMETARFLLDEGDKVGARLAFRDTYNKRIQQGRDTGEQPKWFVSLGHNKQERNEVILRAVELGRITQDQATAMLPTEYHPAVLEFVRKALVLT